MPPLHVIYIKVVLQPSSLEVLLLDKAVFQFSVLCYVYAGFLIFQGLFFSLIKYDLILLKIYITI